MLKTIRRLRGRSLSELRFRSIQALAAQAQRLRIALGAKPAYHDKRVDPDALLLGIDKILAALGGEHHGAQAIVEAMARSDSAALTQLRDRSRQLQLGQVQILGLPELTVGFIPNWHLEAVSGLVAPKSHWSQIPYLDATVVGDHKSLWELNRHQYLFAPALTWLADGDEAAFQLVQRHLSSWLDDNPPSIGINWASSLEVAYRAITWCWLLWLLQKAPWDRSLLSRIGDALLRSGLHVERNLSLYFSPNTHLTGEALSLYYLGLLLPHSRHTERWRAKGASILEEWLARQVYPDGVYTEQAALYQRYTAEIYLHYARLAQASGMPVSAAVTRALHGAFDVLRGIASADTRLPLIGDDDGGQLLPLDQRSPEQVAGVLLAGATALQRPELAPAGASLPAISYALCGVERTNDMMRRPTSAHLPVWRDRYFPDGGIAVLRDGWSTDAAVAVIDAGPHGVLNCGHAHADALAMTLSLGAAPLFVDRGTLTYVGAERNAYRSTSSHNTLEFDGESSVTPLGPFQWGPRPARAAGSLCLHENVTLFRAQAPGHAQTDRPSFHRRVVAHAPQGAWVVVDEAQRPGLARAVTRWQLAPGLRAENHDGVLDVQDPSGRTLAQVAIAGGRTVTQTAREVSLRYGQRTPATVIEVVAGAEARVVTLVVPARVGGAASRLTVRHERSATICDWTDGGGRHQLWVPNVSGAPLAAPMGICAVAQALWVTAPMAPVAHDTFRPELLVALGAVAVSVGESGNLITGTLDNAGVDVVAVRRGTRWAILPGLHSATSSELA